LFNYLLPGVLFAVAADALTHYSFLREDLLVAAFLYYFIGMAVSRFGSLVLEPLLKKTSFVRFVSYSDFVTAAREDPKIEVLSEVNNTYRTLLSGIVLLALLVAWERLVGVAPQLASWETPLLFVALAVLLAFSYRKQVSYVRDRVEATRGSK
jgi:hypothetical protein